MKRVMKKFLLLSITIAMVVLVSCQNSTEIEKPIEPYVSLHIGDMWQIYNVEEGCYTQEEVIDTVRRSDGVRAFVIKISTTFEYGLFTGQTYNLIKDDFLIQTNIDTTTDFPGNKYDERKLAKLFPQDGDYFLQTLGAADSVNSRMSIKIIDSLATPCGKFKNVAEYQVKNSILPYELYYYYAPGNGYIGSTVIIEGIRHDLLVTFKKIDGKAVGTIRNLPDLQIINQSKLLMRDNIIKMINGNNFNYH
jgi:hypothetical protein